MHISNGKTEVCGPVGTTVKTENSLKKDFFPFISQMLGIGIKKGNDCKD